MFKKNIFTLILIFGSIADHDYLVASDKQDSIFNDFTTNLSNLSYKEIHIIAIATGISMYAGYYARHILYNQSDIHDVINEESECSGSERLSSQCLSSELLSSECLSSKCLFTFNKHAFGKFSEDGSQDSLPDLEVIPGYEELDDLYEWTNAMKNQEIDSPKSCRVIPPVRSYHNKSENDLNKSLCQTMKPFFE